MRKVLHRKAVRSSYPCLKLLGCLYILFSLATLDTTSAKHIQLSSASVLGADPQTVNRLNGESFQQDALLTFNGYQYAAFYDANTSNNASVRYVSVARRAIDIQASAKFNNEWEMLTLRDYEQTNDDGHDVISLGISHGDGTLHLSWDQHDNDLNYRMSQTGVATVPSSVNWTSNIFGPITDYLPGLESLDKSIYFINITYPRFLGFPDSSETEAQRQQSTNMDTKVTDNDLLLELRVGRSGLGDDWLYSYTPFVGWAQVGRYLEGVNNNAYINGIDFDAQSALHVTWTYRDYVNDTGQDVAVEAGPNGPENNHDMDYAFSRDLGLTWTNNWDQQIANLTAEDPIVPNSAGITIFSIPKYGGILNQEAQTVDSSGRVHVLNRENTTGYEQWYHYWRSRHTSWFRTAFPAPSELFPPSINNITGTPTVIGKRGKLVVPPAYPDILLAILPDNSANSTGLSILASTAQADFNDWEIVWEASSGCGFEPLFDRYRLLEDGVLSLYLVNGTNVVVSDFDLSGLA